MSTFSDEWAKENPRPEWDKPEHWESTRPDNAKEETDDAQV